MNSYTITSKSGETFGTYAGETAAHALAAMHRDAGYSVRVVDGDLVFASDGDAEVCGGLDAWTVAPDGLDESAARDLGTEHGERDGHEAVQNGGRIDPHGWGENAATVIDTLRLKFASDDARDAYLRAYAEAAAAICAEPAQIARTVTVRDITSGNTVQVPGTTLCHSGDGYGEDDAHLDAGDPDDKPTDHSEGAWHVGRADVGEIVYLHDEDTGLWWRSEIIAAG